MGNEESSGERKRDKEENPCPTPDEPKPVANDENLQIQEESGKEMDTRLKPGEEEEHCKIRDEFKQAVNDVEVQIQKELEISSVAGDPLLSHGSPDDFRVQLARIRKWRLERSLPALMICQHRLKESLCHDREFGTFADDWDNLTDVCKEYDLEALKCAQVCVETLKKEKSCIVQLDGSTKDSKSTAAKKALTKAAKEPKARPYKRPDRIPTLVPHTFALPTTPKEEQAIRDYAKKYGFVVFRNMADEKEVEQYTSSFWDWAEAASQGGKVETQGDKAAEQTQLSRSDPTTWTNANWFQHYSNGIIKYFGVGQCKAIWDIRLHPNVYKAFRIMYNTTEPLCTSFDGFRAFRGNKTDVQKHKLALHIDQNLDTQPEVVCWQGTLNLTDSTDPDHSGFFVAVPKGHTIIQTRHREKSPYSVSSPSDSKRFFPLQPDDPLQKQIQNIAVPKGGLLVWNSLLPHSNAPPRLPPRRRTHLPSLVAIVSLQPRPTFATAAKEKEWLQLRRLNASQGHTTSHWVDRTDNNPPNRYSSQAPIQHRIPLDCLIAHPTEAQTALIEGKTLVNTV